MSNQLTLIRVKGTWSMELPSLDLIDGEGRTRGWVSYPGGTMIADFPKDLPKPPPEITVAYWTRVLDHYERKQNVYDRR